MMVKKTLTLVLILSLSSCGYKTVDTASNYDFQNATELACASKAFLKRNGYIEKLHMQKLDKESLSLELWDEFNYLNEGKFDYEKMLTDRAGTFTDKLYGVKIGSDSQLVFYKLSEGFRCIALNEDSFSVIHANCLVDDQVIRIREKSLICE